MDQNTGTPTLTPPGTARGRGKGGGLGTSKPTIANAATAGATDTTPAAPSIHPPGSQQAATATAGAVTGTWQSGVTVDALWSIDETRNAWMRVVNVGWQKIFNGTDGAFTSLTTLASQARQTGTTINYRVEADGMVHEIYLW
jgi:hypothetical protein